MRCGRVGEAQRRSETVEARAAATTRETIIRSHQNAQRLLQSVGVVIPFAESIDFPHQWLSTRRDNLRFLNLIDAITFLHQHQRQRKIDGDGRAYMEATIDDYERTYALAADVLGATLADLKKPAAELLSAMRTLVEKKTDGAITCRELREATGLPDHRVASLPSSSCSSSTRKFVRVAGTAVPLPARLLKRREFAGDRRADHPGRAARAARARTAGNFQTSKTRLEVS